LVVSVPIISGLLFQLHAMLVLLYFFLVSVPIISGLLFQPKGPKLVLSSMAYVSVPIISGLLFQLRLQIEKGIPYWFQCFSPHYIGSSFSTSSHPPKHGLKFRFQSPLYRVFFFNENKPGWALFFSQFQSPLYRVFFFNSGQHPEPPQWPPVSVPIISGLLFQQNSILRPARKC